MTQSLSQLYIHIIFHAKKHCYIHEQDSERIYSYIGGIITERNSVPICINGTKNHIHIFCILSKNYSLAKFVQEIKASSSKWIKSIGPHFRDFEWQKGYAAFSVSPSIKEKTIKYVLNQQEHHRKQTFQEEYIMFLKEYNVEYNEKYLWED
ncbi:transposase [Bacteroides sp. 224]|uniref:transposase n=1 Tax=Bacteroides sp. 224 TaxID=2302936 RepID=UPI0013D19529|nr:transposase [Bacteroides sp. 224]NDV63685.1 transposase [Bacteroides sp. 224]